MHTPAPWKVNPILESIEAFSQVYQCKIRLADIPDMNESKEYQANAYLIAAAPELLEALKDLTHGLTIEMGKFAIQLRIERAKDIIEKAEGKLKIYNTAHSGKGGNDD